MSTLNVRSVRGNTGGKLQLQSGDSSYGISIQNVSAIDLLDIDGTGRVTMPYQPSFEAYTTSNTSSTGIIVFGSTAHNTGNYYSTSTGRFTAPIAGKYLIISQTFINGTVTSTARQDIKVNGSTVVEGKFKYQTSDYEHNTLSRVLSLSANDYVEIDLVSIPSSGVSLGGRAFTNFSGHLLS